MIHKLLSTAGRHAYDLEAAAAALAAAASLERWGGGET